MCHIFTHASLLRSCIHQNCFSCIEGGLGEAGGGALGGETISLSEHIQRLIAEGEATYVCRLCGTMLTNENDPFPGADSRKSHAAHHRYE